MVFRQVHVPGDKLFVDYAGHTIPVVDAITGAVGHAQLFVAVLGCSNYTYAEAIWSQTLPDWLGSHTRAALLRRRSARHRASELGVGVGVV